MRSNGKAGDPKRVLGYCRVSSVEQATSGISLDAQESRLRAYCAAHGLELVRIDVDRGISAKAMHNRAGLQRALRALRKGDAGGLVAVKLDRLSRSTRDVLDLVERADRECWALHSIEERLDTSSPHGRFVVTVLAGLAQMEREQIGERTRHGMAELRRQGKRTSRFAPFGYRWADGRRVRVEGEQHILRRMMRYRTQGLGKRRIAKALNVAGRINPRTQKAWSPSTIAAVLRSAERLRTS